MCRAAEPHVESMASSGYLSCRQLVGEATWSSKKSEGVRWPAEGRGGVLCCCCAFRLDARAFLALRSATMEVRDVGPPDEGKRGRSVDLRRGLSGQCRGAHTGPS